jgi:8-oxo-dGTP pyrophosphatase MutT (NUDIX family)
MKPARRTSCGVLITDGARVLLGHATRSPRWDIPKGLAEPGEDFRSAAVRELGEETGLSVPPDVLSDLGVHRYLRDKDLALFGWPVARLPDPAALHCRSLVVPAFGKSFPEFDRFGLFVWAAALRKVGPTLARVLAGLGPCDATGRSWAPRSEAHAPCRKAENVPA